MIAKDAFMLAGLKSSKHLTKYRNHSFRSLDDFPITLDSCQNAVILQNLSNDNLLTTPNHCMLSTTGSTLY